jgi:hypothetical protein
MVPGKNSLGEPAIEAYLSVQLWSYASYVMACHGFSVAFDIPTLK